MNSYYLLFNIHGSQLPRQCRIYPFMNPKNKCKCCNSYACDQCFDYPLLKPQNGQFSLKEVDYYTACLKCFLEKTQLDFSKTYEILGQSSQKQIIFLHGAGSSRKMFLPHARQLAKKGYRSILIDLPAHGGRHKQDLTLENCCEAIKEAINLCKTKDFTIVGGSLGGYILIMMLAADKYPKQYVLGDPKYKGKNDPNSIGTDFMILRCSDVKTKSYQLFIFDPTVTSTKQKILINNIQKNFEAINYKRKVIYAPIYLRNLRGYPNQEKMIHNSNVWYGCSAIEYLDVKSDQVKQNSFVLIKKLLLEISRGEWKKNLQPAQDIEDSKDQQYQDTVDQK